MQRTISDDEFEDFSNIEPGELPEVSIQYEEIAVTSAEILALNSTPKTLVDAPGEGKVLEFISAILILDYESAAYATNGDLTVENETGTALSNTVTLANLLAATADKIVRVVALDTADTGVVLAANEAVQLACATGDPVTGDSPMRVKVAYRVHETGL
jgi:hypothetical protein